MKKKSLISILIAMAMTLACSLTAAAAGNKDEGRSEERLLLLRANAAEPVDRVRFLRPMHGFDVVSDRAILVWETPFKAWLVELRESAACQRLENELSLRLDVRSGDSLSTRHGYLVGRNGILCRMETIREVDVPAWREARKEAGL
ncbi:DUF6491 family protein [Arenimonas fontis]|uniref:Uncharacterized protein n=1 Tax=Arenimonas fontis TaxID=2608255 RepID=A0A5B2ZAY0_9GAMM|nr:DUF6491 family protein [Arenimonas fontis]KAA2285848.1 hypothetical protein F0415_04320 [Arenimonas fontis]